MHCEPQGHCWCAEFPALPEPDPARGCYCPACLRAMVKRLAIEYKEQTGKPLGVSGEVAEFEAHRLLGIHLSPARCAGYDGLRKLDGCKERIQIKGRAIDLMRRECPGGTGERQ
jgi:hypothetical protein